MPAHAIFLCSVNHQIERKHLIWQTMNTVHMQMNMLGLPFHGDHQTSQNRDWNILTNEKLG